MAETKSCTTCGRRYDDGAIFCPKDGSALLPISAIGARAIEAGKDPLVGRMILGQFEIRALIGAGAMGRVYRAHQQGMDRDVAVKILHKDLTQNADIVARFLREAKVASKLVHAHLVNVLLAGQLEDGTMYLVMEHLDGVSLQSALLAAGGSLSIARALHIGVQICDAIGEAHQAGVIHRDVKPENVMLIRRSDDEDFVKVLDFGVARLGAREAGAVETQAGLVFGTARYLSPEGARGEPAGPASDVYAIATVLYQCLAGRTPFENESAVSLLVAQIHDAPAALRSHPRGASVPAPIERAIMRNLAKDAGQRDANAHAFGQSLLQAAGESGLSIDDLIGRPSMARRIGSVPAPTPMPRPVSMAEVAAATPGFPQPVRLDRTADDLPPPAVSLAGARVIAQTQTAIALASPAHQPHEDAFFAHDEEPLSDEAQPPHGVPSPRRAVAIGVVVCLAGACALLLGATRLGWLAHKPTSPTKQQQIDLLLTRANAALLARHYDAPPGDNVLELTTAAIAIDAAEARIYQLRKSASGLLVDEALEAKSAHDYARALRELSLAQKLGDDGKGLDEELEEIEAEAAADPKFVELVSDGGAGRFTASARIGDEGQAVHVGEVVMLHATISGASTANDDAKAHFHVRGPGLEKALVLDAKSDGSGGFSASYTFARTGAFSVTFFARPEGFPVRALADVKVVGKGAGSPPPRASGAPSSTPSSRAPTPSAIPSTVTLTPTPVPSTTGTITLTPDPIPFPIPTTTTPPPAPLPTVP